MAIYRTIQMSFWTDTKVIDDFTPEDKFFYLYLMTNPHTNLIGCYEISLKQISDETGYTKETIEKLLDRFANVHKVIDYSKTTKEIFLFNWHKHNWTSSTKLDKPLISQISEVKNAGFRNALHKLYEERKGEDTLLIPYEYPMDTTNTVTVTNTNSYSFSSNSNIGNYLHILETYERAEELKRNTIIDESITEWLEYKDAKKPKSSNHYDTEAGLTKLINKFLDMANQYGTDAVVKVVNDSIGNNYQGITWDRITKFQSNSRDAYIDKWANA